MNDFELIHHQWGIFDIPADPNKELYSEKLRKMLGEFKMPNVDEISGTLEVTDTSGAQPIEYKVQYEKKGARNLASFLDLI